MGLNAHGVRFLLYAESRGVSFARTAMVGRQELHLTPETMAVQLASYRKSATAAEIARLFEEADGFAEPFFRLLGATEVRSFDASDFEGPTDVVDLNEPIPEGHRRRFSVVLDSGTLEHVFNFPEAIRSCMEMVEVEGHFVALAPANNFCGHGFYQFSPELYFRLFSGRNGFELVSILAFEDTAETDWYEVRDPAAIEERCELVNATPTYLAVIARRIAGVPILGAWPYQSDYRAAWSAHDQAPDRGGEGAAASWKRFVPRPLKRIYRVARARSTLTPYDPKYFTRIRIP